MKDLPNVKFNTIFCFTTRVFKFPLFHNDVSQLHLYDNNSLITSTVMNSSINTNEKRPIKDGVDRSGNFMLMQSYDGFTSRL
jgi:hypothetical protein